MQREEDELIYDDGWESDWEVDEEPHEATKIKFDTTGNLHHKNMQKPFVFQLLKY